MFSETDIGLINSPTNGSICTGYLLPGATLGGGGGGGGVRECVEGGIDVFLLLGVFCSSSHLISNFAGCKVSLKSIPMVTDCELPDVNDLILTSPPIFIPD